MANSLQFGKEAQMNLGNAGNKETQAMVCQLLAMKMLKEYSTRELIDALSYDFFPSQGSRSLSNITRSGDEERKSGPAASRISSLEIAIRAQAKHFLAHPLVVQQLEAIWAGTIVFHFHADHLHRSPPPSTHSRIQGYGTHVNSSRPVETGENRPAAQRIDNGQLYPRRTVTIYNPKDASLFKLSRLRVPRYRQFFNTLSLAILLTLFVAVLKESATEITRLEVFFWLWSAGFMLDEIVGFTEQGFSLYIMSFWNAFDLGILLLLIIYYGMRIYGILLFDHGTKSWNGYAYDVLAANAVLLFPRLFSVLDHYRYFSQLLIAFRLMAVDLVAVLILILVSCSGFFVAFTFAFGTGQHGPSHVAFQLFQIWIGFTPTAWAAWEHYNFLGRAILMLFLFISHFLTVTILVSVLSNSFMAIVSNANAEHQFVFAVNTISMVKNDSLFSYMAPSNLIAWVLTPLRYIMSFRGFIKLNRYVIKITHFPLLLGIYGYERMFLARKVYEATDLIEGLGRGRNRTISFLDPTTRTSLFSPTIRLRQESTFGYQKDRALEEVFRVSSREMLRPPTRSLRRRETTSVVKNWMNQYEGVANSPLPDNTSIVNRLEKRGRLLESQRALGRHRSGARSLGSITGLGSTGRPSRRDFAYRRADKDDQPPTIIVQDEPAETADEGDDELGLATNDEDDTMTIGKTSPSPSTAPGSSKHHGEDDYFRTPNTAHFNQTNSHVLFNSPTPLDSREILLETPNPRTPNGDRAISTNTAIYNPTHSGSVSPRTTSKRSSGMRTPTTARRAKPRTIAHRLPHRQSAPDSGGFAGRSAESAVLPIRRATRPRQSSSLDFGLGQAGSSLPTGVGDEGVGAMPASFATQMAMATGMMGRGRGEDRGERVMGRLVLARMKTLEEGIQDVARELKVLREERERERIGRRLGGGSSGLGSRPLTREGKGKERERERERGREVVVGSLD